MKIYAVEITVHITGMMRIGFELGGGQSNIRFLI